jgi:hypothetical protein
MKFVSLNSRSMYILSFIPFSCLFNYKLLTLSIVNRSPQGFRRAAAGLQRCSVDSGLLGVFLRVRGNAVVQKVCDAMRLPPLPSTTN